MSDKDSKERFFEESILLTDVIPSIVLRMPFLTMSNDDVDFQAQNLQYKTYTTQDALPSTRQVELIRKKEFATTAFDPEYQAFVVHIATISIDSVDKVHPSRRAQIAHLKADEASSKEPSKYVDFADVFSPKLAANLLEHIGNHNHAIELVGDWKPPYGPINSLGPVELKTLKAYIENNLANNFIRASKSPARALILFNQKPDSSLRLCVDYWGLNNLTIKNRYSLHLVGKLID